MSEDHMKGEWWMYTSSTDTYWHQVDGVRAPIGNPEKLNKKLRDDMVANAGRWLNGNNYR